MVVRREEVLAPDDVLAELGWVDDGDGLDDRTRLELGRALSIVSRASMSPNDARKVEISKCRTENWTVECVWSRS
jgi:hypothetical protein